MDVLLNKLEFEGFQYLKHKSGIGIVALGRIVALLDKYTIDPESVDQDSLKDLVAEILDSKSKDELWAIADNIVDISDTKEFKSGRAC